MPIECTLMNKNTPVLKLKGQNIKMAEAIKILEPKRTCEIYFPTFFAESVSFMNKFLCPPGITSEDADVRKKQFNTWFSKRCVSKNRAGLPEEVSVEWTGGEHPNYFSLSDQYWIKYSEDENWADLNFFTNKFSLITGDALFSRSTSWLDRIPLDLNTPEITTNGILNKRWILDNKGNPVLVKMSSKEALYESINEVLASQLLLKTGNIKYVPYELQIIGYNICCTCSNIVDENTELVTCANLYNSGPRTEKENKLRECKAMVEAIKEHLDNAIEFFEIPGGKEFIRAMTAFDRKINNQDRHFANCGFLRNVNTGKYIGPAPLFDFGNAFMPKATPEKSKNFAAYEDELFATGNMQVLDTTMFSKILDDCNLLTLEEKMDILKMLEENNNYIIKRSVASNSNAVKDFSSKTQMSGVNF